MAELQDEDEIVRFKLQEVTEKARVVYTSDPKSVVPCDNCGQHIHPPYWRTWIGGLSFTLCPGCKQDNLK